MRFTAVGYSVESMKPWKLYWDHQLYKGYLVLSCVIYDLSCVIYDLSFLISVGASVPARS